VEAENREIQVPLAAGKSRDLPQLAAVLALAERITRRILGDIAGIADLKQHAHAAEGQAADPETGPPNVTEQSGIL
jgi:hypothetical protein